MNHYTYEISIPKIFGWVIPKVGHLRVKRDNFEAHFQETPEYNMVTDCTYNLHH